MSVTPIGRRGFRREVPTDIIRRNGYRKRTIQAGCGSLAIPFPISVEGGIRTRSCETLSKVHALLVGESCIPSALMVGLCRICRNDPRCLCYSDTPRSTFSRRFRRYDDFNQVHGINVPYGGNGYSLLQADATYTYVRVGDSCPYPSSWDPEIGMESIYQNVFRSGRKVFPFARLHTIQSPL
ncbi:hypothetical protein [Pasteuria penetrans]|uniref:hypothetical protein n=1 Tax=Pasteuria penetrans TaxID=86005 RepID=UPI000F93A590|nr:hypothetical protein [Pasteuria penetrans]